ncbi:hypothetical protein ACIBG8_36305 [Nonomuraea sp. NPDC050556]|uniref:hypothetical protein n=1 Tax=Nonomuraea sp. NPDC050556 TaxID=3364369 RepID=UPI00379D5E83
MDTATLTRRPAPAGAAPRGGTARWLTLGTIGAAVAVWLAGYVGLWQLTLAVGVAIGLVARGWAVPVVAVLAGAAGWGVPLALLATQADVAHLAGVVASLAGLGSGPVVIAATVAVGALLTASGAWVGSATRSTIRSRGKHDV